MIIGIVQRRQVDAVLDSLQHFVRDDRRFGELLAAMNHAVPHGVNVRNAPNFGNARIVDAIQRITKSSAADISLSEAVNFCSAPSLF